MWTLAREISPWARELISVEYVTLTLRKETYRVVKTGTEYEAYRDMATGRFIKALYVDLRWDAEYWAERGVPYSVDLDFLYVDGPFGAKEAEDKKEDMIDELREYVWSSAAPWALEIVGVTSVEDIEPEVEVDVDKTREGPDGTIWPPRADLRAVRRSPKVGEVEERWREERG